TGSSDICIDQTRIKRGHVLVTQFQPLSYMWRKVCHQDISPFDEPSQNLRCMWVLQIHYQAALVAIIKLPWIVFLRGRIRRPQVVLPVRISRAWFFYLNHFGTEVRQHSRSRRASNEAGDVQNLKSPKQTFVRHTTS